MCAFIQPGTQVQVTQSWDVTYPDPLTLRAGELVHTGQQDDEWPGWIWCTDRQGKSGWAPLSCLEIDESGKSARARQDYSAAELAVQPDEHLLIERVESGWGWAVNQRGESGWVPLSHVTELEEPQGNVTMLQHQMIEDGVFDIPLLLTTEMEPQRAQLQAGSSAKAVKKVCHSAQLD